MNWESSVGVILILCSVLEAVSHPFIVNLHSCCEAISLDKCVCVCVIGGTRCLMGDGDGGGDGIGQL